jgi:hypothetical protein
VKTGVDRPSFLPISRFAVLSGIDGEETGEGSRPATGEPELESFFSRKISWKIPADVKNWGLLKPPVTDRTGESCSTKCHGSLTIKPESIFL